MTQFIFILFAMIIGAAFEVLGIGLILPLIDIILSNDTRVTGYLGSVFPTLSRQNLMLVSVILFAIAFILKGIFLSALAWLSARFVFEVKADVSNALFRGYLRAPYEFHIQHNSAQLIRNLTTETAQLVGGILSPILMILTEFVVIIAIVTLLIIVEPTGTLVVSVLLVVLSMGFHRFVGSYTSQLGKIRQHADGKLIQSSQEALGGIKEVQILAKGQHFIEQFNMHNHTSCDASAKQFTILQLPRMYLETIGALIFSILITLLILRGEEFQHVIPVLGVFAFAAFRLLPSANRVLSAINAIRFADAVIFHLNDQLKEVERTSPVTPSADKKIDTSGFKHSIKISNLSYQYPRTDATVLSDINFTIFKGESIGVIGESGAGKSTLSDAILGLIKPSKGAIFVDGVDIANNIDFWQSQIGYVQQDIFLLDDSILKNIAFGELEAKIDSNRINLAVAEAKLDEFVASLPEGINTNLGERGVRLSGGQKQRIGIARALYRDTPILIFDEATSSLDNKTETEIVEAIRSFKGVRTTIVIAHRLSTIEHCDRVVELKNGRISKIEERKIRDLER